MYRVDAVSNLCLKIYLSVGAKSPARSAQLVQTVSLHLQMSGIRLFRRLTNLLSLGQSIEATEICIGNDGSAKDIVDILDYSVGSSL